MTRASIGASVGVMIRSMLAGLRQREDSEHVQALIRIGFGLGISTYLYATAGPRLDVHIVCIGFEILSIAIFAAVVAWPKRSAIRRAFGTVLDLGTTTYLMWSNAEIGAPLYGIYLWVTFGNGFRFGLRSLYASQIMSLVGFAFVIAFNPFWHQHALMAGGFMMLLLAVPFYGAVLLKGVTAAQDKAEQANAAKTRFLSVMSHEIRTPLNGIIGINALLRKTKMTPEQLDLINTLGMSSEVLLSLLDNVLDIAKIEAGKMPIERVAFDLHQVIDGAMKIAATQAAAKGLHFGVFVDGAVPRFVVGDPHRLRQVLINLLSNATKFTELGGVHLRVTAVGQRFGRVTIRGEVIDTGVGMSAEALAQIFQPFVQADQSTTRQFGGTGLGTTIARQLVELMGGRMGAESKPDEGSTFWFEIALPTREASDPPSPLPGLRVLLVGLPVREEDRLAGLLQSWQVTVDACSNERAADKSTAAGRLGTAWHAVVVKSEAAAYGSLADLDVVLPDWKRRPKIIGLGPVDSPKSRPDAVRFPYTAAVSTPAESEALHRALHFAGIDELTNRERAAQWKRRHPVSDDKIRPRVLVAEDNATNRKIIAQVLEYGGFDVTLATTGTQAIMELEQGTFDVVILDKFMPGMSGMEVAKAYIASRGKNAAPMIMLTAEATAEAMQQCKDAGMQAFLTKPIDPEMLFETIGALTGAKPTYSDQTPLDATSAASEEHVAILDESVLEELHKHAYSEKFVADIVESFESDMLELIERLECSVASEDWSELGDIRHAIEGTARGSGASAIAALVEGLKALPELESEPRRASLEELRHRFNATQSAMQAFLAKRTVNSQRQIAAELREH